VEALDDDAAVDETAWLPVRRGETATGFFLELFVRFLSIGAKSNGPRATGRSNGTGQAAAPGRKTERGRPFAASLSLTTLRLGFAFSGGHPTLSLGERTTVG
jgi:hypothetical protein